MVLTNENKAEAVEMVKEIMDITKKGLIDKTMMEEEFDEKLDALLKSKDAEILLFAANALEKLGASLTAYAVAQQLFPKTKN